MSGRPTLSSVVELGSCPLDLEQPGSSPLEEVEEQADLPPKSPWGEAQEVMGPQVHPV